MRFVVSNCIIDNNSVSGTGGGLDHCDATIDNCTISNNSVTSSSGFGGGGMYITVDSEATLVNCIFSGKERQHDAKT